MHIRIFLNPGSFPGSNDLLGGDSNINLPKFKGLSHIDLGDIRDADTDSQVSNKKQLLGLTNLQAGSFWPQFIKLLNSLFMKNPPPTDNNQIDPADIDGKKPSSTDSSTPSTSTSGNYASNLQAAAANTHVNLKPVIRGDEAKLDAQVHDQASFGRLADQVAKEYGLDPNQFRAQLQAESAAFSNGYKQAMGHRGDVNRGANASLGLGQISGNFLNGGPWANALTNTPELGKQNISSQQYMNSVTTQLRMAAASDALRIHRVGSLDGALRQYVSGHSNADSQNQIYIDNINKFMRDQAMMNIGR